MKELVDAVLSLRYRKDRCREENYSRLFDALSWYLAGEGEEAAAGAMRCESEEIHRLVATWQLRDEFKDPFDEEDEEVEEGIDEDEESFWYAPI